MILGTRGPGTELKVDPGTELKVGMHAKPFHSQVYTTKLREACGNLTLPQHRRAVRGLRMSLPGREGSWWALAAAGLSCMGLHPTHVLQTVGTYMHICIYTLVSTYVYIHVHTYAHTQYTTCKYKYTCNMHVHTYIYVYIYTYAYTHIGLHMHVCMHVSVYRYERKVGSIMVSCFIGLIYIYEKKSGRIIMS